MAEPYLATCPTCGDQHRAERWRDVQEQSAQRQRERAAWEWKQRAEPELLEALQWLGAIYRTDWPKDAKDQVARLCKRIEPLVSVEMLEGR